MKTWQLQEAKARLSKVLEEAEKKGPQQITVHGEPTAMIVSIKDFKRLKQPKMSLVNFMRRSPWYGVELDIKRNKSKTGFS